MRISDWSSDVCSSITTTSSAGRSAWRTSRAITEVVGAGAVPPWRRRRCGSGGVAGGPVLQHEVQAGDDRHDGDAGQVGVDPRLDQQDRSEEHTSELQSLMRISYAVFCLKKKNKNK